jgi:hypothetical protein
MSTVDSTGAAAQQAIFDKLGINTQKSATERASGDKLGQDDFLQLMTAQLQNQDPFAPMENGDFIAQMAQFSTVSGIEEINTNLKALSGEMQQTRIATASTLLGHSVRSRGRMTMVKFTVFSSCHKRQVRLVCHLAMPQLASCFTVKIWGHKAQALQGLVGQISRPICERAIEKSKSILLPIRAKAWRQWGRQFTRGCFQLRPMAMFLTAQC